MVQFRRFHLLEMTEQRAGWSGNPWLLVQILRDGFGP